MACLITRRRRHSCFLWPTQLRSKFCCGYDTRNRESAASASIGVDIWHQHVCSSGCSQIAYQPNSVVPLLFRLGARRVACSNRGSAAAAVSFQEAGLLSELRLRSDRQRQWRVPGVWHEIRITVGDAHEKPRRGELIQPRATPWESIRP